MTKAILSCSRLRVYNRKKYGDVVAFPQNEKTLLKNLGFTWDNFNKSYLLNNPSESVITELSQYIAIQVN